MSNKQIRNSSIDLVRYICALLIVGIHTSVLSDINTTVSHIITGVIAQMAVPFFFTVSGFFYIQKLERGENVFKKYIGRLLITYTIWSAIYFVIDLFNWGYLNIKGYVVTVFYNYFLVGSHYHLWFMLALIYCVCIVTLIYKLKQEKLILPIFLILLIVGCLGGAYYGIGERISLLNNIYNMPNYHILRHFPILSLPFFACGQIIHKINIKFSNTNSKRILFITFVSALLWIAEIYAVKRLDISRDFVISIGIYLFIITLIPCLLKYPLPRLMRFSQPCLVLANFTYYSHPLFIELINTISEKYKLLSVQPTILFMIVSLLTAVFGLCIFKINNKYLNRLV